MKRIVKKRKDKKVKKYWIYTRNNFPIRDYETH